jgi:hypothetical protein
MFLTLNRLNRVFVRDFLKINVFYRKYLNDIIKKILICSHTGTIKMQVNYKALFISLLLRNVKTLVCIILPPKLCYINFKI